MKMMNTFALIRNEDDDDEEIEVRKVLPLPHCSIEWDKEGDRMSFVRFMRCVRSLDAVDDAPGYVGIR